MKRAIALLLALTVLGAAGMVYAHRTVSASAEAVEMYETVLSGDRAAAEGVEVQLGTHCLSRLHWDSTLRIGAQNAMITDFRTTSYALGPQINTTNGSWDCFASLSAWVNAYSEISGELDEDEPLRDIVLDVASRTEPAQQRRETVYLRDWFESFPMRAGVSRIPGGDSEGLERIMEESFKIPVPEDWQLEVAVTKNAAGAIAEYSTWPVQGGGPELDCLCDLSSGVTLWLAVQSDFGDDGYECPGADCLYYMKRSGPLVPVFEIPEDERIEQVDVDRLDRLLLLVNKAGTLYLRVYGIRWEYDAQREYDVQLECLQDTELMSLSEYEGIRQPYRGENFLLAVSSEGRLALAELTDSGQYIPRLTAEICEPGEGYAYSDSDTVRLWDGERLVMASALYDISYHRSYDGLTGVIVWVYDETGCTYCARYDCSQCIPEPLSWSYEVKSKPGQELSLH